jgi:hypothetical protein
MQDRRNFAGDVFCPQLSKGYPQWLSKPRRWPQRVQAEPKTLVGLGSLAGLLLLLAKIVEDVIEKESGTFDRTILLAFRVSGHASQPIAWLTSAFRDVTSLGGPTIITLIMVIAVAYLFVDGRNRFAVLVAISIASGAIAEKLMKLGFDRARPDVVPHLTTVHSPSFPSDHAMLSAITYLTLGALLATRAVALAEQDIHPIHRGFDHPSYWAEPHLPRRPLADPRVGRLADRIDLGARILARSGENTDDGTADDATLRALPLIAEADASRWIIAPLSGIGLR